MGKTSLEQRIERLEAEKEINELMCKYEYFHTASMLPEHVTLFAKRDDTCAQVGTWGMYRGYEGIRRLYAGVHCFGGVTGPGWMFEHAITTGMIVVAGDGKTAKGVWISPGHETLRDRNTGKVDATWCWVKYGCDFIRMEDGHWYIWHLFVFLTMSASYYKGWEDGGEHRTGKDEAWKLPDILPPELKPDAPSIPFHDPYDPNKQRAFMPAWPKPYGTYDMKEGYNWMNPKPDRRKPYPHDLDPLPNGY